MSPERTFGVVELDDAELHYVEAGDGPLVLCVHGFPSCSASFHFQIDALAGDHRVVAIDALESRRMSHGGSRLPPGTEAVDAIRAEDAPGVWVVALGTNDVASDTSLADFRAEMRDVLDRIPVDDPVIWVDLWIGGEEELVARANRMIRVELRRRSGGTAVVDWYSHGTDAGVITVDGVHLTQTGQDLFAESIAVAVDELFAD